MTTPQRLQLSRKKGFDLQKASRDLNGLPAVVVARPSKFANPLSIAFARDWNQMTDREARAWLVNWYRGWVAREAWTLDRWVPETPPTLHEIRTELRGKNLACWCKSGEDCHADILLRLASERGVRARRI